MVAHANMPGLLGVCVEKPPLLLPVDCPYLGPAPTTGFGAGPNKAAERMFLCPNLLRIQKASCAELVSVEVLAEILASVARSPVCCKLKWSGLILDPHDLAAVLLELAARRTDHGPSLRFITTDTGNGWVASLAAAYLQRLHGGVFNGLMLSASKSEWSQSGTTRMLTKMLNLTLRHTLAFDGRNDSSLMSFKPQTRSSLSGSFYASATSYLPRGWEAWSLPPPFDVCLRVSGRLDTDAIIEQDWRRGGLAAWCGQYAFYGARTSALAVAYEEIAGTHSVAHKAGNFTIVTSSRTWAHGQPNP